MNDPLAVTLIQDKLIKQYRFEIGQLKSHIDELESVSQDERKEYKREEAYKMIKSENKRLRKEVGRLRKDVSNLVTKLSQEK